jgi:uncharacterized protein YciI
MGGCAKNGDKKDGKDGNKDAKDGNHARLSCFGIQERPSEKFFVSKEKKLFFITLNTMSNELTDSLLAAHMNYLNTLNQDGKLKACGAFSDGKGGYQVLVSHSEKEIQDLLSKDPLVENNYYKITEIRQLTEWQSPSLNQENLFEYNDLLSNNLAR